ncbi:hypothetical protein HYPBUDRAFT_104476 [Hyphopichia burtonii NRRL Y-1933]|uniref:B-related factor 1 n=1 Tax=Hyphopichia burtonii NRRL Y-1933 TaxID=984485 RepID=A0A1E4RML2_9ASCO|nr:hypothetical protein HYPBUDRAFT_104476 [Hyphopichia burtonii NRRL Y-1933]ODV68507.1 hypothetical protein HYPBUDRAFT_104476 [Hyphopichia burtonii NRRL Y-1933]
MSRVQNKIPTCRNCGAENSFQVDRTTAAGDLTCTVCGTVQEENPIVSEVQFGESSSGAATVQGSMVGSDQARAGYGSRQNAMESREQTLLNGKRKIQKLAIVLKIQPHIADAAGGWFNLALTQNFVQGRRSQNVLATCLYIACRKERTHHMLIDFSSRLQISVYSLGATFLKMVKALTITNLPLADPSLFIQNFVESLNFGDKSKKIARDACKLAQRMSNDWIHEGRRPAGIAGACVLLAARMNNIRRTHSEIVNVAHVAPETLQRRLNEFKKTASGSLTVKEFRQSKAPAPSLPPSYYKNRAIEEKLRKQIEKKELALRRYIELANKHQLIPIELPDILKPKEERERLEKERQEEEKKKKEREDQIEKAEQEKVDAVLQSVLMNHDLTEELLTSELQRIINRQKQNLEGLCYQTPAEKAKAEDFKKQVELDKPRNLVANLPSSKEILDKVNSDPLLNSSDEDEETRDVELTGEALEQKIRIWTGLNYDYIIEQEKKRLKEEADILTGNTSGTRKKRRIGKSEKNPTDEFGQGIESFGLLDAVNQVGEDGESISAADSARKMISKKPFSKKINYDTLHDLFTHN